MIRFSHPESDGKSAEVGVGGRIGILKYPFQCKIVAVHVYEVLQTIAATQPTHPQNRPCWISRTLQVRGHRNLGGRLGGIAL